MIRIAGPSETPFEGNIYIILFHYSEGHPFDNPPSVQFLSHILHPNISDEGYVCLDILNDQWSPVWTITTVCVSVQSLLSDPNSCDPMNLRAAKLFQNDKTQYALMNKEYSSKYADDKLVEELHTGLKVDGKFIQKLKK